MAAAGVKKAAMLLMGLDAAAAAELLKAAKPEVVTEIAAELAYLRKAGAKDAMGGETIREFFGLLRQGKARGNGEMFVKDMLENVLGKSKSLEALRRVQELVENRDPFMIVRQASVEDISEVLAGEAPQVAALVLAELPPKKSAQLLGLLPDAVRGEAVKGMTCGLEVAPEARLKVAAVVRHRLDARKQSGQSGVTANRRDGQLRKVAVLLRGLDIDFRKKLLESITQQDKDASTGVQKMMVLWEDMPIIADRALQEILRTIDTRKLALALVETDEAVKQKLRANMSERASAMLDEETSLLSKPKHDDVLASREVILNALRELNNKGDLAFEEG